MLFKLFKNEQQIIETSDKGLIKEEIKNNGVGQYTLVIEKFIKTPQIYTHQIIYFNQKDDPKSEPYKNIDQNELSLLFGPNIGYANISISYKNNYSKYTTSFSTTLSSYIKLLSSYLQ